MSLSLQLTINFYFRSDYVYSCLDARFYDDEILTVVLQESEEQNGRRLLAQLPIACSVNSDAEFNWEPNVRCVLLTFFFLILFNYVVLDV